MLLLLPSTLLMVCLRLYPWFIIDLSSIYLWYVLKWLPSSAERITTGMYVGIQVGMCVKRVMCIHDQQYVYKLSLVYIRLYISRTAGCIFLYWPRSM
ncbi:hypothetical protein GGR56DRAFT_81792 [Xylariaceae sp. FL0804]|nr:hypothetical protein GGR56DRAFT_81792 [Xylariaceae sp. FL0804]